MTTAAERAAIQTQRAAARAAAIAAQQARQAAALQAAQQRQAAARAAAIAKAAAAQAQRAQLVAKRDRARTATELLAAGRIQATLANRMMLFGNTIRWVSFSIQCQPFTSVIGLAVPQNPTRRALIITSELPGGVDSLFGFEAPVMTPLGLLINAGAFIRVQPDAPWIENGTNATTDAIFAFANSGPISANFNFLEGVDK